MNTFTITFTFERDLAPGGQGSGRYEAHFAVGAAVDTEARTDIAVGMIR